ncbi:MAG: adhesion protein [Alkalibacterium sp.]|nr:adhesion protein [Alkalibacterium sp.]
METILFVVLMVLGHLLMMHFMPGMGGHSHGKQSPTDSNQLEVEKVKEENRRLKEELAAVKTKINN